MNMPVSAQKCVPATARISPVNDHVIDHFA
jgi:hypothetical protein